jgi:uncharacterized protein (TIGR02001 family)
MFVVAILIAGHGSEAQTTSAASGTAVSNFVNRVEINLALVSDYIYRGISLTDGDMAIQGGLDYRSDPGFYAGIWASNISDGDGREFNYYAGFTGNVNDSVGYDVGVKKYDYPSAGFLDYEELYVDLSYNDFTLSASYIDDLEGFESLYTSLMYSLQLQNSVVVDIFGGITKYGGNYWNGEDGNLDYGIEVSKNYQGFDFALSLTDTNLKESECNFSDNCNSAFAFKILRKF